MIDVKNIKQKFEEYVSKYNPENERISLKIEHIKNVAKNCEMLAKKLNFNEEDTNLAIAIGYFHDIGRFEQVRIADTFSDKESKINHAEKGVEVLENNDFIREFIKDDKYDNIIKKAVLNHNKASKNIDKDLTPRELLFAKIIRDADKIDIFRIIADNKYSMKAIFWYDTWNMEEISKEVLNEFYEGHELDYSKIQNNADVLVTFYAYMYDLNFEESREIIWKNKYLDIFTKRAIEKFSSEKIKREAEKMLEKCKEI